MSGLKTLAYLLILIALAISQPAQLLCQAYALMKAIFHLLYCKLPLSGDHNTTTG